MTAEAPYARIVAHYEACLDRHGDSHLGVDWPDEDDARTRYDVMLNVIREDGPSPATLLDFGCGASHLYDHLFASGRDGVAYAGLDLSPKFVALSREKHPGLPYYELDVLREPDELPVFDYVVVNGVLTEKLDLSDHEMTVYSQALLRALFAKTRIGLAFNVMSAHVDWTRPDLFHVPFDEMARFVREHLSRQFAFRQDYGLYEYTTYVYR